MKKLLNILKWTCIGLISFVLVLWIALVIYARNPYTALDEMNNQLEIIESNTVAEYEDRDEIRFTVENPKTNIIFLPGGLVTPDSYKYVAYSLALDGHNVTIAKAPYNLAILKPWLGREFVVEGMENIVIGHSLGGVVASIMSSNEYLIDKVILMGSYPIRDLSSKEVLFITAEHDLGLEEEAFNESMVHINEEYTTIIDIEGGNHAQFGWYGPQKGDGEAEMDTLTQQDIVIQLILDFIN